jgi:hypothetical protein
MEDVIAFFMLVLLIVLVFYAGWKTHEWFMFEALRENPEVFEKAAAAARKYGGVPDADDDRFFENMVEMEVETHNGIVYAYNKSNGQFLAQAENVTEAAIVASKRFPGVAFTHPDITMDEEDQKA